MTQHGSTIRDFLPLSSPADGKARAGAPLADGTPTAGQDAVIEALKTVHDPEIPVNIYDLGLIYELEIEDGGRVLIGMTLTAPACPVAGEMPQWVADAVAAVEGVGEVEVSLLWDPPWSPDCMSDDAKMLLDFG
ncbi:MAG: SUF system Fe-S cluster assembly protein [Alphaproteobacteria bacterium]|nr:SUF system Fe-S cluster assembly protein [Alphaproteobacteria bacterium]